LDDHGVFKKKNQIEFNSFLDALSNSLIGIIAPKTPPIHKNSPHFKKDYRLKEKRTEVGILQSLDKTAYLEV